MQHELKYVNLLAIIKYFLDSIISFYFFFLPQKSKARGDLPFILHHGSHSAANYVPDYHTTDANIGWKVTSL